MMKHKQRIGMDQWCLSYHIADFLRIVKRKGWSVYEIGQKGDLIIFYTSIVYRNEILRTFEEIEHLRTTGMLGFLLRQMRRPSRLLCVAVSALLWYGLSHTIFTIELQGDKQETKDLLSSTLNDMGYTTPFYSTDMQSMKNTLKKRLENDVAWLEMSQVGSRYHIQFTTKEFADIETLGRDDLIAQRDGVIARFELQHGSKMVALNQYVHKGDILVSNILMDSGNAPQDVYVKGRVFAYTWKEVHVEMENNELPKPFQFYQLLFEARNEAARELGVDEKLVKENILQFQDNTGTISMDIHYTLLQDISTPR